MKRWLSTLMWVVAMVPGAAAAEVVGRTVDYSDGVTPMKGYIAYDNSIKGPRPGVLIVHEWWGMNDYARHRTDMFAKLGYTAMALDMFGEGKTADHPKDAQAFATAIRKDMPVAERRFDAALRLLREQPSVDPTRIAAVGYCFGGGIVLHMARIGTDLKLVGSFHGGLGTDKPAAPGKVKAEVFVANGEADPLSPPETVAAFVAEMQKAGVLLEFHDYPNAKHAFTNPKSDYYGKEFNMPVAYNKAADEGSWAAFTETLKRVMAK